MSYGFFHLFEKAAKNWSKKFARKKARRLLSGLNFFSALGP